MAVIDYTRGEELAQLPDANASLKHGSVVFVPKATAIDIYVPQRAT